MQVQLWAALLAAVVGCDCSSGGCSTALAFSAPPVQLRGGGGWASRSTRMHRAALREGDVGDGVVQQEQREQHVRGGGDGGTDAMLPMEVESSSTRAAPAKSGALSGSVALFTALAFASILISYADRSNLATAIIPMSEEYGWNKSFQGTVLSTFFIGYALTQMLGGGLADVYGGRTTLVFGLVSWSLFTMVTPLAAAAGAAPLLAARIGLGLGEGFAFPSIHAMIAESVPEGQQSTVVGVVTAASYVGAALAFAVSPLLAQNYGWESIFYVFGGFSLLLGPAWLLFTPPRASAHHAKADSPRTLSGAGSDEAASALMGAASSSDGGGGGGGALAAERGGGDHGGGGSTAAALARDLNWYLRRREVQAILVAQFTQSVGMTGLLSWLPTYLHEVGGVDVGANMGALSSLPYILQAVVGVASGALADSLIARRMPVRRVRQWLQGVGMVGPAIALVMAAGESHAGSPYYSAALLTVGSGLSALTLGGVSVSQLDIAPSRAGLIFGAGNTAGTLAGLFAVPASGWLVDTFHSWDLVLYMFAVSYVVGAVVWCMWVGGEELEPPPPPQADV